MRASSGQVPTVKPRILSLVAALGAFAVFFPGAAHAADVLPPGAVPPAIEQAEGEAAQWLLAQMVPNDIVPAPDPGRRRLLVSYRVPRDDPSYRFVYGRSFVYDDALGAIALTMLGRYREAEYLMNALQHLVRSDGSLWFACNTQNSWPGEADHDGAIIRSGSVAWVGYAFTYYVGARVREASLFAQKDPLGIEYLRTARAIAAYLRANQVRDPGDPRFGLVTGGLGSSQVALDTSSRPQEIYSAARVRWVSMEHNLDSWFFLRDLARLTSDSDLAAAAEMIRASVTALWSEKDGQFLQGIRDDGTPDVELPLDGASWGALYLLAQGRDREAKRCIEAMQGRFSSELNGLAGYRPYGPARVYTDERVNGFFFPSDPGERWQDLPFIWGEGSLGAAAALIRAGDRDGGLKVIDSIRKLALNGGLRYASSAVAYQFTDYPSVASTSWFIIAVEILRGAPAAGRFWGQ